MMSRAAHDAVHESIGIHLISWSVHNKFVNRKYNHINIQQFIITIRTFILPIFLTPHLQQAAQHSTSTSNDHQ